MFVMANEGTGGMQELRFFDEAFHFVTRVAFVADWAEGPGVVKRPDGQLDPGTACDRIGVDLMRAVGGDIDSWDLAHSGVDVATGTTCDCRPVAGDSRGKPGRVRRPAIDAGAWR
jgi:hypothetical protein